MPFDFRKVHTGNPDVNCLLMKRTLCTVNLSREKVRRLPGSLQVSLESFEGRGLSGIVAVDPSISSLDIASPGDSVHNEAGTVIVR